nr:reverse transcriptase domain-containing protein [Tanacetum cinerariifolium]
MECDVNRLLERCHTCHIAKTHSSNASLYTPLSVSIAPWDDFSLDFVLGLSLTQRAKDSVMLITPHVRVLLKLCKNPITPLDLVPVPEVGQFSEEGADQIKELHQSVQEQIIRHNKQYKEHADKRCKQINENAYKIELPGHYNVSAAFNVADLSSYKGDSDDEPESRSSLFQEGKMMQMQSTSAST